MDVTTAGFVYYFLRWEQMIIFRSGNMIIIGTQCCIFIAESLNFKTAKPLLGMNYS